MSDKEIEANPKKIKALIEMESPKRPKEMQKQTGCVAALNCFISKATDKCIPFFNMLRGNKRFEWTEECEEAFQQLKQYLGKASLLSKPVPGGTLNLYLSISQHAVNSVLVRKESKNQLPVCYVSKRLPNIETR